MDSLTLSFISNRNLWTCICSLLSHTKPVCEKYIHNKLEANVSSAAVKISSSFSPSRIWAFWVASACDLMSVTMLIVLSSSRHHHQTTSNGNQRLTSTVQHAGCLALHTLMLLIKDFPWYCLSSFPGVDSHLILATGKFATSFCHASKATARVYAGDVLIMSNKVNCMK